MKLVIVESPYAGDVDRNLAYARRALRDCLLRGEAPLASHLLYTQPGVLDDDVPAERTLGIEGGLSWGAVAELTVVYADLGWSAGMRLGVERAKQEGRPVEIRYLDGPLEQVTAPASLGDLEAIAAQHDGTVTRVGPDDRLILRFGHRLTEQDAAMFRARFQAVAGTDRVVIVDSTVTIELEPREAVLAFLRDVESRESTPMHTAADICQFRLEVLDDASEATA